MALDSATLRKFASLVIDDTKPAETTAFATVISVNDDGTTVIQVDGSNGTTTVGTMSSVSVNDRVQVQVKHHQMYINGNATDISASTVTVNNKANKDLTNVAEGAVTDALIKSVSGYKIDTSSFTDGQISGTKIDASSFTDGAISGTKITDSTISESKIADATITNAKIVDGTIEGTKLTESIFKDGYIQGTSIDGSTFSDGQISGSKITDVTITDAKLSGKISADHIDVDSVTAKVIATKSFSTETASIADAQIASATIKESHVENLTSNYAHITSGVIDNATISTINGKQITNSALLAKVLSSDIITTLLGNKVYYQPSTETPTDPEEGDIWYQTTTENTYDPLNDYVYEYRSGSWVNVSSEVQSIFMANSITAQAIVAHSITATQLTTDYIEGEYGKINLAEGLFSYWNDENDNGISWDGEKLKLKGSVSIESGDFGIRNYIADSKTAGTAKENTYILGKVGSGQTDQCLCY